VLLDRTLMAMRWIDLLAALSPGTRPPLAGVLRAFFVSSFVSNFIPSVGADLYRAYVLSRYNVHLAESTASVLMDRALGVLAVGLVGAAALPLAGSVAAQRELVVGLGIIFGVCAVAIAVIYSESVAERLRAFAGLIPVRAVQRVTGALTEAVRRYATHHRALTRVLVMTVLVQVIRVLQTWCLGIALGIHLPLLVYFVFVPIIVLIAQLPITINGFGTTQVAFARLFVPQGAPAPEVFALSVLFLALGILGSLPGGLLYALDAPVRSSAAAAKGARR
jgi:glycosyltransferase 2 family protein